MVLSLRCYPRERPAEQMDQTDRSKGKESGDAVYELGARMTWEQLHDKYASFHGAHWCGSRWKPWDKMLCSNCQPDQKPLTYAKALRLVAQSSPQEGRE